MDGYESLERLFRPQLDELMAAANGFLPANVEKPVHFITAKGLVTQPFWQTLYELVNHGSYHRGQVANMLRIPGRQAVGTDIFLYFREQEQVARSGSQNRAAL